MKTSPTNTKLEPSPRSKPKSNILFSLLFTCLLYSMALTAYLFPGQNPIGAKYTFIHGFFAEQFGHLGDVALYATIGTIFLIITLYTYVKSSRNRIATP